MTRGAGSTTRQTPVAGQQRGANSPPPGMLLGPPQGRPRDEANGPFAILRRWLFIIAVAIGVTMAVLYLTDSGPFAPPGGDVPVAVAAPDPRDEPPLGEDADHPAIILTEPRFGYQMEQGEGRADRGM